MLSAPSFKMALAALALSWLHPIGSVPNNKFKVGLLFEDPSMVLTARQIAGKETNIELAVERIDKSDAQTVVTAVNRLMKRRIVALIVPSLDSGLAVLESMSTANRLPTIILSNYDNSSEFIIAIGPDFSKAGLDLVRFYQWESFAFLYDIPDGMDQLLEARDLPLPNQFQRLRHPRLASAFVSGLVQKSPTRILIDLKDTELTEKVVLDATRVRDIRKCHFILSQPINPENDLWSKIKTSGLNLTWLQFPGANSNKKKRKPGETSLELMLLGDSLRLTSSALLGLEKLESNETYDGDVIKSRILEGRLENGATGPVSFDRSGKRSGAKLTVVESGIKGMSWNDKQGLVTGDRTQQMKKTMTGVKLKVTTILHEPYLMRSSGVLTGFCKDLIDGLAEILGFEYELTLAESFGTIRDQTWTGMIGQLVKREADLALGAITVTKARDKVVDFTMPFQNDGITVLVPKPEFPAEPGPGKDDYFFLKALKLEIWCCHLGAWIIVGFLTFVLLRLNFDPNRDIETRPDWPLETFWNTLTPLFVKSTSFQPRSPSIRMITGVWWLYGLMYFLLYCGTLACMLLVHHQGGPSVDFLERISTISVDEYLEEALMEDEPNLGTIVNRSTHDFFQRQNPKKWEHQMLAATWRNKPELLSSSISEGSGRVRDGGYAFLVGSADAEYWAACHGSVLMDRLNELSVSLALRKGSPHRRALDSALMKMQENGDMRHLRMIWWNHSCPSTTKDPSYRDMYHSSISLQDLGAIFYGLILGVVLTFVVAGVEGCIVRRQRRNQTVSLTYVKRGVDVDPPDFEQTFL